MMFNLKKSKSLFTFLMVSICHAYAQQTTMLIGNLKAYSKDTLAIYVTENSLIRSMNKYEIPLANGDFNLPLQINTPAQLVIKKGNISLSGIIEPGEEILLAIDSMEVRGTAAAKFKISTLLQQFTANLSANKNAMLKAKIANAKSNKYPLDYLFNFADSAMTSQLEVLQNLQHLMSNRAYTLLKADILGKFMLLRYNIPTYIYNESHE